MKKYISIQGRHALLCMMLVLNTIGMSLAAAGRTRKLGPRSSYHSKQWNLYYGGGAAAGSPVGTQSVGENGNPVTPSPVGTMGAWALAEVQKYESTITPQALQEARALLTRELHAQSVRLGRDKAPLMRRKENRFLAALKGCFDHNEETNTLWSCVDFRVEEEDVEEEDDESMLQIAFRYTLLRRLIAENSARECDDSVSPIVTFSMDSDGTEIRKTVLRLNCFFKKLLSLRMVKCVRACVERVSAEQDAQGVSHTTLHKAIQNELKTKLSAHVKTLSGINFEKCASLMLSYIAPMGIASQVSVEKACTSPVLQKVHRALYILLLLCCYERRSRVEIGCAEGVRGASCAVWFTLAAFVRDLFSDAYLSKLLMLFLEPITNAEHVRHFHKVFLKKVSEKLRYYPDIALVVDMKTFVCFVTEMYAKRSKNDDAINVYDQIANEPVVTVNPMRDESVDDMCEKLMCRYGSLSSYIAIQQGSAYEKNVPAENKSGQLVQHADITPQEIASRESLKYRIINARQVRQRRSDAARAALANRASYQCAAQDVSSTCRIKDLTEYVSDFSDEEVIVEGDQV